MYIRIGQVAKLVGVSQTTIRRWEEQGILTPAYRTPGNHRRYEYKQVQQDLGILPQPITKKEPIVIYARLSAPKQKEDLQRQIRTLRTYAETRGWEVLRVYKDIDSGINDNRKQLLKLLTDMPTMQPTRILCTYKDRIARFGTKIIEEVCKLFGTTIVPIKAKTSDEQDDLVQGVIAVLYSFSGKLYRRRRGKGLKAQKKGGSVHAS